MAEKVHGFVIATQSCDIVRSPATHPYVEVCPLVEVNESVVKEVKRFLRPGYMYIPALAEKRLVADLNRTMTVEKTVVATWDRIPGCTTDEERRKLQGSLARKRERFAFPDDFNAMITTLKKRFKSKHNRLSPEGAFLRDLPEIRVQAMPSWAAESVELFFWFLRDEECENPAEIVDYVDKWMTLLEPTERFVKTEYLVSTFDDITARDYMSSDMLDLGYLSTK